MASGNSSYNIPNKQCEGHRFVYNAKNPDDTMIIIHRELADHARQVLQREREREHSVMIKDKTKKECI